MTEAVRGRPEDQALLELARATALAAADLVAGMRRDGVEVAATKSTATDVVTAADRAAEELIRQRIAAARPDDGFLGEEGGASEAGTSGVRWVVDPIDGTVNFLYGIPAYAVSIAAEVDGQVRAGVVVDVARSEVWSATRGGGAHRDRRRLEVRESGPLEEWLVRTGFGYAASLRAAQAVAVGRMLPQVRDVRRIGSCALDLCAVAAGESDAYVEEGVHDWDHAAAGLVLEEAGGRWEVLRGASGGDLLVASGAPGFPVFRDLVVSCGFAG
ncbi:MAG: inositol monophosphatase family protein [Nocardioides sp.]|nr:inositol monophosphatase family protein [Nocardioides sp.]